MYKQAGEGRGTGAERWQMWASGRDDVSIGKWYRHEQVEEAPKCGRSEARRCVEDARRLN